MRYKYFNMFLVIFLSIFCSAIGDGDLKFRDDYKYESDYKAFYKFHDAEKSFFEAWAICHEEDSNLVIPFSMNERDFLKKFGSTIYLGLHDMIVEGTFTTTDSQDVTKIFVEWESGEPNNYGDNEDCVVMLSSGEYNDFPCYLPSKFVCKKESSDLNKQPTLSKVKFRSDYLYFKELDGFYKYHGDTKIFTEAVAECEKEGTQLLIPSTKKEIKFMKNYMLQVVWLGFHDRIVEGKFQTIDGKNISDLYINWGPNEPSPREDEDCVLLYHDGKYNDITCEYLANFICEIRGDTIREKEKKPGQCDASITSVKGVKTCKGQLIFEEYFDQYIVNRNKWTVEHRLPNEYQENGFISYQHTAVSIDGNKLKITPTLQHNSQGFSRNSIFTGTLDLTLGCTAKSRKFCKTEADSYYILPPIVTGRVTSRDFFSFKYGRIEIRAKLPQGNWIYPELYLEPAGHAYGNEGYESGLMRIAFARGNLELRSGDLEYGNNVLSAGVVLDQFEPCRSRHIVTSPRRTEPWGNGYHTYGLTWNEESITLDVDNETYGTIEPPENGFKSYRSDRACKSIVAVANRWESGTYLAPYDQEFYITIGMGVGGVSDFPNNLTKPWKNGSPKAKKTFWSDEKNWYGTWKDDSRILLVDSIKVWAI